MTDNYDAAFITKIIKSLSFTTRGEEFYKRKANTMDELQGKERPHDMSFHDWVKMGIGPGEKMSGNDNWKRGVADIRRL